MTEARRSELVTRAVSGDADALQCLIVEYHEALRGVVAGAIEPAMAARVEPEDVLQEAYAAAFEALKPAALGQPPSAVRNQPSAGLDGPAPERKRADITEQERGPFPHFDAPAGFYKWLERIALNQLRDAERALRRQKRDIRREIPAAGRGMAGAAWTASYADLLQRLTAGGSTPSRHVVKHEGIAAVITCLARLSDDQRAVVRLRFLEDVPVAEIANRLGKTETAVYTLCHRGLKTLREQMESLTRYVSGG